MNWRERNSLVVSLTSGDITPEVSRKLSHFIKDRSVRVRRSLAQGGPNEILNAMIFDPDVRVRRDIAFHSTDPDHRLLDDQDPYVRFLVAIKKPLENGAILKGLCVTPFRNKALVILLGCEAHRTWALEFIKAHNLSFSCHKKVFYGKKILVDATLEDFSFRWLEKPSQDGETPE
jgi:hypothetical protein